LYGVPLNKIYKSKKKCNVEFYILFKNLGINYCPLIIFFLFSFYEYLIYS